MSSIANHPHDVHDPEQTEDSCNSPFHLGEQQLQIVAGVRDQIERSGRKGIRRHMLEQHQLFYSQLHFVVISALDQDGQPWGTILTGVPGFVRALDDAHLYVGSLPGIDEPLCGALTVGCSIGLLGIELDTRRRNRLNGVVSELDSHGFCIEVMQSFGNCPKYIQQREFGKQINSLIVRTSDVLAQLDSEATSLIQRADTFFIATHAQGIDQQIDAPYGTDVSHRGGKPGFVRVVSSQTLVWPDFVGNGFFNTLGNVLINPRAGLLFPDFECGNLLYIAGNCTIIQNGPELAGFKGAERLILFQVEKVIRIFQRLPWSFNLTSDSPFLSSTGDWLFTNN